MQNQSPLHCQFVRFGSVPVINVRLCTFQNDKNLFMLLEFVVGGELFSHLRRAGRFTEDTARFYAGEIGLTYDAINR